VEKVGMSNTGDSTISHKAEVFPRNISWRTPNEKKEKKE
jgi:hypothetical protein